MHAHDLHYSSAEREKYSVQANGWGKNHTEAQKDKACHVLAHRSSLGSNLQICVVDLEYSQKQVDKKGPLGWECLKGESQQHTGDRMTERGTVRMQSLGRDG